MLDIYPDHKNVVIEPETETLVQAISDRAIDILLVPNRDPNSSEIAEITRRSAERQISHCYQYAGPKRLSDSDFSIELPRHLVEDWYQTTVESGSETSEANRQTVLNADTEWISQRFRRIGLERALGSLPASASN
jgi:hypothetical protein